MNGYLRNIIPFSAVDGPGNRTAVFLQGCNLNCWYCHNPETIEIASDSNPVSGSELISAKALCERIMTYADFTSGVTFSGGECSVQSDFLIEVCRLLKEKGRHILIDTNGYMNEATLEQLIKTTDGFMFDVKAFQEADHLKLTGKSNDKILANLNRAAEAGMLYEVRTVILPELLDNEATVTAVANFIGQKSPETRYKLIRYRSHGVREDYVKQMTPPETAYMAKLFKLAKEQGAGEVILL